MLEPHTERHLKLMSQGGENREAVYGDGAYRIRKGSFGNVTAGRIPRNILQAGHISAVFTRLSGKQAMGHGDFKLLAALGAWSGWQLVPVILYGACLLGCAFFAIKALRKGSNGASRMMPFGPCLAVMGWILLMWGHFVREVATTLLP